MKKMKLFISAFIILFFLSSMGNAATMTISIDGLDATTPVEGFTIWLDVSDFSYSNFTTGDAIPPAVSSFGWLEDNLSADTNGLMKIGYSDWDYLMDSLDNPLVNGTMVTFDYSGSIDALNLAQLFKSTDWYNNGITLETFSDTNINFQGSAVPIPGALWLLGSGLIGIVGIRRKLGKS
jgi:hypothetical protein